MALSTQTQAACLLLLLIASLSSGAILQQQLGQPAALQPWHRAESSADRMLIQTRKKRDTHFPTCIFCCHCCKNPGCGLCCKT
ncbi:hepcidin [Psammomys obesus]|uniref:hepcidin n=1 Tax=Psammomys obesus TaxID=48139 RepID=UPI0024533D8D|nr:hepcidin [Psammomys obesus]